MDYFIPRDQWNNLTLAEQVALEAQLKQIFGVRRADPYPKYADSIPPGAIKFRRNGQVEFVPLNQPYSGRPENVAAIETYIRQFYVSGSHVIERHGPQVSTESLRNRLASEPIEVASKFATVADINHAVQSTLTILRSEIESEALRSTVAHSRAYPSETVAFQAYSRTAGYIEGTAPARVAISFDGRGHWGILTAYPDVAGR